MTDVGLARKLQPVAGEQMPSTVALCRREFRGLRAFLLYVVTFTSLQFVGCCYWGVGQGGNNMFADQMFSNFRQTVWARRAYNLEYGPFDRAHGSHFRRGYVEGYCAICRGDDGYVPATPPKAYWGHEYQSGSGSQYVGNWFEGYPEGVAAAKKSRAGKNADVYVSKMIDAAIKQDKTPVRVASDIKVVKPESPPADENSADSSASDEESGAPPAPPESAATPLAPATRSMIIGQGKF